MKSPSDLTPRQTSVLNLVGEGRANKEIAYSLGISESRVKQHVSRLMQLFHAGNRAALVANARK
jgi:DNA-binding NarL/FixJ family response regulator